MPYFLLSAEAGFSAAHTLPEVDKCEQFHGHNWRIRLTIRVDEAHIPESGMSIDLQDLERTAQAVVADFDHAYLNDLEPFRDTPPTSERIARVVCDRATARLAQATPTLRVEEVEVWEMPHYRVSYRPQ